jgi:hypothetical protein
MRVNIIQLLNAATMIFPYVVWRKFKKMKQDPLHRVMKYHVPIATCYHVCEAFFCLPALTRFLMHADIFCIHMSSLAGSLSVIRKCFNNKHSVVCQVTVASCALHTHAFIKNIGRDQSRYRFILLVLNTMPVFILDRGMFLRMLKNGSLAFSFFMNDRSLVVGHSCFHVMLYRVYDDYFTMISRLKTF